LSNKSPAFYLARLLSLPAGISVALRISLCPSIAIA
jgi:hypothetical protein